MITKEQLYEKMVKVSGPKENKEIQEIAFNLGFIWWGGEDKVEHLEADYLYFHSDDTITWSQEKERGYQELQASYILGRKETKAWVAMDSDGEVNIYFTEKPTKNEVDGYWDLEGNSFGVIPEDTLPADIKPTWEDKEPIEVIIKITTA